MIRLCSFARRRWTIPLHLLRRKHVGQAGAKAVNLGRMMRAGLPVPMGFVLKTGAFQQFLDSVPERAQFERWLTESVGSDTAIEQLSRRIQATIAQHPVAPEIQSAVQAALAQFPDVPLWAVRSSGTAEDSPEWSFAGQHDSFLNVVRDEVLSSIRCCWASFFNDRAVRYRIEKQVPPNAGMAVIIQAMVPASSAGVLFTSDPVSGNRNRLVLEAARGLAQALVSGRVEPERTVLARYSLEVLERELPGAPASASPGLRSTLQGRAELDSAAPPGCTRQTAGEPTRSDLANGLPITNLRYSAARHRRNQSSKKSTAEYTEYAQNCLLHLHKKSPRNETILGDTDRLHICATNATAKQGNGLHEETAILDRQTAQRLAKLSLRAEQLLAAPLDIEWAMGADEVYLLQARPITGLPAETWEDRQLWSNINAGENLPDVVSPMAWSLLQHFLDPVLGSVFRLLGADTRMSPLLGRVAGRVYFNLNAVWAALRPFWFLLRRIPNVMVALGAGQVPLGDQGLIGFRDNDLPDVGFRWPRYLLSLPRQLRDWLAHSPGKADAWTLRLVARGDEVAKLEVDSMSVPELVQCFSRLVYESLDGWDLLFLGPQGLSLVVFQKVCRDWLQEPDLSMGYRLFAALDGIPEAEAGLALWGLATLAHADPNTEEILRSDARWPEVQARLSKSQHGLDFLKAWTAFMSEHGHHGRGEIDVARPRWCERPDYILGLVRSYLGLLDNHNPAANHQRLAAQRRQLTDQCFQRLRNPVKRWIFARSLARAQKLAVGREVWKNEAVRILAVLRRVLLRLGEALRDQGRLINPEDIFFLEINEVEPVVSGKASFDVQSAIRERRAEYARNLELNPPPLVAGRFVPGKPSPPPELEDGVLKGIAVSPGTVTGRARVLLRNDDHQQVLSGEILVAPFTDPAWTPYFIPAAGLVTEQGGILSHGSIIAREYGIPAVTSVIAATRVIHSGDLLEVDGNAGRVCILSRTTPD